MTDGEKVVALLGHFSATNLGDDACPTAVLHNLRRLRPQTQFILFCRFPDIAHATYNLPSYPVARLPAGRTGPWEPPAALAAGAGEPAKTPPAAGWRSRARAIAPLRVGVILARAVLGALRHAPAECRFLWHSYRTLRRVDLLIVTGSNPIFDQFGGFWGYPMTIWKWALLARLTGTRVAYASVGAGPIVSARSGRLLSMALRWADYVSFRDQRSRLLMERYGPLGSAVVYPDLAQSLPYHPAPARVSLPLRVGINPMIVHDPVYWPESDVTTRRRYIDALVTLATELERDGYEVFLYGTQKDDAVAAAVVQSAIHEADPLARVPEYIMPGSVSALLDLCAEADVLVATRFHGAVFGVMTATPTLAICYHGKTREVLEQAGLGESAVDLEEVSASRLREVFDQLVVRRQELVASLREHAVVARARLEEQYRSLDELLGSK